MSSLRYALLNELREVPSRPRAPGSVYSQSQGSKSSQSTTASSVEDFRLPRHLDPGVFVPIVAFFEESTEDLDLETLTRHIVRLAEAGVAGIVTQGSNGEAVHLTHQEKSAVTRTSRQALDDAGFPFLPIIVGCGAQSVRETVELCQQAQASGGNYALVLPPSYYKPYYRSDCLIEFFQSVADASPIPILIYNYPGAVGGIDIDSDVIAELAKHPNIVGCKLTCGNTGKLCRIAAAVDAATPFEIGSGFMCMGGSADFTLQTLVVGGSGVICGLGNIAPKACVEIVKLYTVGKLKEASTLQAVVARGDWQAISGGVVGTKSALEVHFGYGGMARRPFPCPTKMETMKYAAGFQELVDLERSL